MVVLREAARVLAGLLAGRAEAGDEAGTAAAMMAAARLDCLITIGGDGTNRAVLTGWRDAVLVPFPGGTNNAATVAVVPDAVRVLDVAAAAAPHHGSALMRGTRRRRTRPQHSAGKPIGQEVIVRSESTARQL